MTSNYERRRRTAARRARAARDAAGSQDPKAAPTNGAVESPLLD
ncbi:hypothetical protein WMF37_33670 [Sorangium sp. So ce291]